MLKEVFGTYNIRSRISVGLIFLAPILLQAYILIPEIRTLSSTFIITLIAYALSSLIIVFSRMHGSRALFNCYPDILPAQQYLLPESTCIDAMSKARYYSFLERHVPGFEIVDNDTEMRKHAESAVTWLISQTRNTEKFPLIAEENMNLSFSYNLLGLKPYAIWLSIVLIIIDVAIVILFHVLNIPITYTNIIYSIISTILCLFVWIFIVSPKLVRSCGKKYARALLSACDSPHLNN